MASTGRVWRLGKDQEFSFPGISNVDIKSVEINVETANEADVTTRGSGDDVEYVPIHRNTTITVNVLNHSTYWKATGVAQINPKAGTTGMFHTGVYYVNSIGDPQNLEGEIVSPIQLRRHPG